MTMRIVVENTDTSRKASIQKRARQYKDGKPLDEPFMPDGAPILVEPGAKAEVWIHNGLDIVVTEV